MKRRKAWKKIFKIMEKARIPYNVSTTEEEWILHVPLKYSAEESYAAYGTVTGIELELRYVNQFRENALNGINPKAFEAAKTFAETLTPTVNPLFLYDSDAVVLNHKGLSLAEAIGNRIIEINPNANVKKISVYKMVKLYRRRFSNNVDAKAWDELVECLKQTDVLILDYIGYAVNNEKLENALNELFSYLDEHGKRIVLVGMHSPQSMKIKTQKMKEFIYNGLVMNVSCNPDRIQVLPSEDNLMDEMRVISVLPNSGFTHPVFEAALSAVHNDKTKLQLTKAKKILIGITGEISVSKEINVSEIIDCADDNAEIFVQSISGKRLEEIIDKIENKTEIVDHFILKKGLRSDETGVIIAVDRDSI